MIGPYYKDLWCGEFYSVADIGKNRGLSVKAALENIHNPDIRACGVKPVNCSSIDCRNCVYYQRPEQRKILIELLHELYRRKL